MTLTLTFDLYVILFGQGGRSHPKWPEVSIIESRKFQLTARMVLRTILLEID